MKRTEIRIDGFTGEELDKRFKHLEKVLNKWNPAPSPRWITKTDTAKMLCVSTKTLHNWNKAGVLTSYSLGNRVYYRSDEVEAAMKPMNSHKKG